MSILKVSVGDLLTKGNQTIASSRVLSFPTLTCLHLHMVLQDSYTIELLCLWRWLVVRSKWEAAPERVLGDADDGDKLTRHGGHIRWIEFG